MLDHSLEATFAAFFRTVPELKGVRVFTGHDNEEHTLPSITVTCKSESLAGSAEIFRADIGVMVESEAHDSDPDEHAALVEIVRSRLSRKDTVATAFNTAARIRLYGYAFTGGSEDVSGNRFQTTITLRVGYGAPINHRARLTRPRH